MQGSILLFVAAVLPMLAAPLAWVLERKHKGAAILTMIITSAAVLGMLVTLFVSALGGQETFLIWDGFCGLGLQMRADGFRALYACIAGVMWLVTSIFSRDYFKHGHAIGRYALFTLITFGAMVGLLLSDTFFSAFIFFEIMSLASYPWVAHEETPDAMRAAETYLYIAVIGGLVMLMGIFLLPNSMASMSFSQLPAAAQSVGVESLMLSAILILVGFGAKAGAFPLHIWLPKAHPVAPAPASALLSGMLTKAGIFGMIVLTTFLMRGSDTFADLLFRLGVITMFLGALLAVFSVNLKRTLACSSLSQIGFIMVGVGLCGLLQGENGLAAYGTVQHMVNHSLFKLILFISAGVVAMNTGMLHLNDVRGYGRGKIVLHIAFLTAALGISGVPFLSGYISKSLLHEGLLEYIAHLQHMGLSATPYAIAEWVFIISGGMTFCYMLKLYICLFWQKHPTKQAEFDAQKKYLSPLSSIALLLCTAIIPILGTQPDLFMTGIGELSSSFLNAAAPAHHIEYFSSENLIGAGKSLIIGFVLYQFVCALLMDTKGEDETIYLDRWPKKLDLENLVYRPLISLLLTIGGLIASFFDMLMDWVVIVLRNVGFFISRILDGSVDWVVIGARKTMFATKQKELPVPVGTPVTYAFGRFFDNVSSVLNKTVRKKKPIQTSFVSAFAAGRNAIATQVKQLTSSISFGLLMFCLGLYVTLSYLLF
ncbi:MAG: sodium:proton antiporter [Clostridiales bacterium]|nr:sodium:proton antiporter [Clostridiales bacterium]